MASTGVIGEKLDPSKMSSSCPPIKLQYSTSIWFFFAKLLTLLNLSFSFLFEYGDAEIFINNFEGLSFKYFLNFLSFTHISSQIDIAMIVFLYSKEKNSDYGKRVTMKYYFAYKLYLAHTHFFLKFLNN